MFINTIVINIFECINIQYKSILIKTLNKFKIKM